MWDTKEDKQGELFDGLNPKKKYSAGSEDENIGRPLGEELIDTLIDLLFLPGFTLPFGGDEKQGRAVKYTIWASGIGSKSSPGMTVWILSMLPGAVLTDCRKRTRITQRRR